MNILLITPYFPPQNAVASLRVHGFARHWTDAGAHVTVLTTAKREDQRGLDLPCAGIEIAEIAFRAPAILEGVRALSRTSSAEIVQPSPRPRHGESPVATSRLKRRGGATTAIRKLKERTGVFSSVRMPDLTDWWVRPALKWCRNSQRQWDVVVSSSGPYTAHLCALKVKRFGLAQRWFADFRDLWTQNHVHTGLFPFTLREKQLERKVLRQADRIIASTDGLADALRAASNRPVEIIYNGFDETAQASLPRAPMFPPDDKVRLAYTGTLYPPGQNPAPLLRALAHLHQTRPDSAGRFRIVVAGRGSAIWAQLARVHNVADLIEDHGMVSRADALRLQRDADALIAVEWSDARQGVLTGKIFEYLSAEPPILVIGGDSKFPIAQLVLRAGRGVECGTDPQRIAQMLVDLAKNPARLRTVADRAFVAGLSRQRQSLRLLQLMQEPT